MKSSNYHYLAIASLAIGVINLCTWLLPICGIPLSIAGLILGFLGRNSSQRSLAFVGISLCVIGLVLGVVNAIASAYLGLTGQLY